MLNLDVSPMPRSLSNPTVAAQPKPAAKPKDRGPGGLGRAAMPPITARPASTTCSSINSRPESPCAAPRSRASDEGKANLKDAYGLLKDGECVPAERAHRPVLATATP